MTGDICSIDDCPNEATTENFEGMIGEDVVIELVCSIHADN